MSLDRVVIVAICAVLIVLLVLHTIRGFRRGGDGPTPKLWPATRRGRMRVNASWKKHGWTKPFDDDGNLIPADQREAPRAGDH